MIVLFWNDVFIAVAVVFAKTPYTLLSHIERLLFERSEQLKGFKYIFGIQQFDANFFFRYICLV